LLKARLDEQVITRQDEMQYISKVQGMEVWSETIRIQREG